MGENTDSTESVGHLFVTAANKSQADNEEKDSPSLSRIAIVGLTLFACLYVSSLYSYLLFHGIAEIFSISICVCIFVICLNSRDFIKNGYLLFIGISYLFVGIIDVAHTLAYKGMGVFSGYDANLPTQLWIAARYLQGFSLLVAPAFFRKKPNLPWLFASYATICLILFIAIFSGNLFPDCFIEGVGLTSFKIVSEYIICIIFMVSLLLLALNNRQFEPGIFKLLAASIIVTIFSELAFTSYASVYGFFNLLGHFLKILAFYLLYKALVETGFKKPYSLIFRELSEERKKLKAEIEKKERLQKELELSEERYRTVADFAYDWEYWINPEGQFVYVSPSCERITGYTAAEFISNPNLIMDIMLDDDRKLFQRLIGDHLSNTDTTGEWGIDFRIQHRNGEIRWIGQVAQSVYGANQQYLGMRASNKDITERKHLEEEKQKVIIELQNALSEVKKLSGFLPICASCKKIRDDKGYWNEVEQFISERSETQFSHSICPDCMRKLYPEEADEILGPLEKGQEK
jgi:PAS domain S-box-containing protein